MTQYILHIMSYEGLVAGACHVRARVEGPHPPSCHGGTVFHGSEGPLHGKTTCAEGHELPGQVRWNVEARWSEAKQQAWADGGFKGASPEQFYSKEDAIDRAMVQFLDGMEKINDPAEEGDELWYGWVSPEGGEFDEYQDPSDNWGMMIARKCTS